MQIVPWVETPWKLQNLSFTVTKAGVTFIQNIEEDGNFERQYGLHMRLYKLTGSLLLNIGCIHWNHTVSSKTWWPWWRMSAKIWDGFYSQIFGCPCGQPRDPQSVRSWIIMDTSSDTDRRVVQLRTWAPIWWLSQIFGSWLMWTDPARRCRGGSKGTVVSALGSFRWSEATWKPFESIWS